MTVLICHDWHYWAGIYFSNLINLISNCRKIKRDTQQKNFPLNYVNNERSNWHNFQVNFWWFVIKYIQVQFRVKCLHNANEIHFQKKGMIWRERKWKRIFCFAMQVNEIHCFWHSTIATPKIYLERECWIERENIIS